MNHIYALRASLHSFSEAWQFSLASGFRVDHFCAHEPVILMPCCTCPDPVYCSVGVGEITKPADKSKLKLTWETLPSPLFAPLAHFPTPQLLAAAVPLVWLSFLLNVHSLMY